MGTLSWILTVLALNGALMGGLLAGAGGNRWANRFLAALVGLISLRLVIYVLGFAGLYDSQPWITFAPLDASLAFGPLLWLYVVSLTRSGPPRRWGWHLAPAALQLAYSATAFALPLQEKLSWYRGPHLEVVQRLGLAALLVSATVYLALAWRRQRQYQRWLDERFADRERWRLGWLTAILAAFAATLAAAVGAALIDALVTPLDYFSRVPVVVASSLLAYALGLLGWRNAGLDLPAQAPRPAPEAQPGSEPEAEAATGTASELRPSRPAAAFAGWAQRVEAQGWWREEGLTLAETARRLGTSERTLSRALSEGAGVSFNAFVNGLRVEAVMRAIAAGDGGDLLALAMDCGFSSKASFNRAFLRHAGTTPSRWRASAAQVPPTGLAGVN